MMCPNLSSRRTLQRARMASVSNSHCMSWTLTSISALISTSLGSCVYRVALESRAAQAEKHGEVCGEGCRLQRGQILMSSESCSSEGLLVWPSGVRIGLGWRKLPRHVRSMLHGLIQQWLRWVPLMEVARRTMSGATNAMGKASG